MPSRRNLRGGMSGGVALVIITFCLGFIAVLTNWTERNLEFYLSMYKGEAVDIPYWIAFLLTLVLNGIALLLNIVGELIRMVL